MDTGFLGIIVSCFNEDSVSRKASLQMTAFQAHAEPSGQPDIKRVPVSVVHPRSWCVAAFLDALDGLPPRLPATQATR